MLTFLDYNIGGLQTRHCVGVGTSFHDIGFHMIKNLILGTRVPVLGF